MSAAFSWTNNIANPLQMICTGNFSSCVYDAAYPAANMLTPDPSRVTRVNYVRDATAGGFVAAQIRWADTAALAGTTRLVAALNVRLPSDVTELKVYLYSHTGAGIGFAGADYAVANLVKIPGTVDRYNVFWLLAANDATVGYTEFRVYVPVSTAGYFEIGHVWAGPALVTAGTDENWQAQPVDGSASERTDGGAGVFYVRPVRWSLRATLPRLTKTEAFGTAASPTLPSIRTLQGEAGTHAPMVVIFRSDSTFNLQTLSVYGSLRNMPPIRHVGADLFDSEIDIEGFR